MGDFKTCDIHDKEFPANLIDTNKTTMVKLFAEKKEKIAGKDVTLSLFIGNNKDEGADTCHACNMNTLLKRLEGLGIPFSWKVIKYSNEKVEKRDGSGTYDKLVKGVYTVEEYTEMVKKEQAQKVTPTTK